MAISPATTDKLTQILMREALGAPAAQARDPDVELMRRALTEKAVANVLSGTRWLTVANVEAMQPERAEKARELLVHIPTPPEHPVQRLLSIESGDC